MERKVNKHPAPVGSNLAPDHAERCRVLDPTQSFIVQAPAGSGKTGLLIQRYLKLLTCIDEPEEIVAITFTRKAAAEMRERVTSALGSAAARIAQEEVGENMDHGCPSERENLHEKVTRELAEAVLQRDKQAGWDIVTNPARLRIQTFDSLCASLTRQMPVLSEFGSQPELIEDASDLYLEAARATIGLVEGEGAIAHDVQCLLEHLDNEVSRIEILLVDMLARRDHWLRYIYRRERDELEAALRSVRRDALQHLSALFPATVRDELAALLRYASDNLVDGRKEDAQCGELTDFETFPDSGEQDAAHWLATADLLLTKEGGWRKQHIARDGFPAGTKAGKEIAKSWKDRAATLVSLLAANDDGMLRQALHDIRLLPPASYTERQWQVLGAITRLLPRAVAELRLVFQSHNKVDFTEMAQGALRALGEPEMPTDLALALDYRIQHLLIDEFQDTSISQYELITKLTAGWEPEDGRSILVVGDPMQSIYRFREAEVGLFLRARAAGFGDVTLHPIFLSANFRSQRGIIDWVNSAFTRLMPSRENISLGAVVYSPSVATAGLLDGAAVSVHPFFNNDHAAEAEKVVEIAAHMRQENPSSTTAILVRNRSHLGEIIPRLKEAGLRFRAVDIEGLGRQTVVQDLLVLTRAMAHPADRVAWLALLRAPWCGLTLADLHILASRFAEPSSAYVDEETGTDPDQDEGRTGGEVSVRTRPCTIWESILDEACLESFSADGRARVLRILGVLKECMANRFRCSLRETVEAAWVALGGPACVEDATSLEDASAYLDYLESKEDAGSLASLAALEEGLDGLFALPDLKADNTLQILTIHKAKGLEFDCVIIPGLGRSPRRNDKKLFMWTEYLRHGEGGESGGSNELLLAPIQETGTEGDRIYSWLEKLDAEKEHLEAGRLLYVAATRAKKRLHLLGSTGLTSDGEGQCELKPPGEKTLLSKIWPVLEPVYSAAAAHYAGARNGMGVVEAGFSDSSMRIDNQVPGASGEYFIDQSLRRLVSGWAMPPPPPALQWEPRPRIVPMEGAIEYSWAGETARLIGNIVHRWLQRIAMDGLAGWDERRIHRLREAFRRQLVGYGMFNDGGDINAALERVIVALTHAVREPRGRWLLEPRPEARSELRITGIVEGEYRDFVIDRTFCDTNGWRWIVDYKTSSHEGGDVEGFLDREQERYRAQLDRYASIMRAVDERPVRRGLYFPMLNGWREWGDEA
jgi:ATP-dependent helicase/nuclease subunit A